LTGFENKAVKNLSRRKITKLEYPAFLVTSKQANCVTFKHYTLHFAGVFSLSLPLSICLAGANKSLAKMQN
jgi:hypothetical protein